MMCRLPLFPESQCQTDHLRGAVLLKRIGYNPADEGQHGE
jgi:hypothetical protein